MHFIGSPSRTRQAQHNRGGRPDALVVRLAARWLIEPNEIRTLPERQALVLANVAAPLLVRSQAVLSHQTLGAAGQSANAAAVSTRLSATTDEAFATTNLCIGYWGLVTRLALSSC